MSHETKPGRLLACERSGRWAIALRRELADTGIRVWETRTLDDCASALRLSPASFAVLELDNTNIDGLVDSIKNWQEEFPLFRFAVAADRGLASYKWLMYEVGAALFICSVRKTADLAQTACRHLAQVPALQQSLTERIWASLPWGREA
jgi:hypothetical protein